MSTEGNNQHKQHQHTETSQHSTAQHITSSPSWHIQDASRPAKSRHQAVIFSAACSLCCARCAVLVTCWCFRQCFGTQSSLDFHDILDTNTPTHTEGHTPQHQQHDTATTQQHATPTNKQNTATGAASEVQHHSIPRLDITAVCGARQTYLLTDPPSLPHHSLQQKQENVYTDEMRHTLQHSTQ